MRTFDHPTPWYVQAHAWGILILKLQDDSYLDDSFLVVLRSRHIWRLHVLRIISLPHVSLDKVKAFWFQNILLFKVPIQTNVSIGRSFLVVLRTTYISTIRKQHPSMPLLALPIKDFRKSLLTRFLLIQPSLDISNNLFFSGSKTNPSKLQSKTSN